MKHLIRLILSVFVTISTLIMIGCGGNSNADTDSKDDISVAVPVEVATVESGDISAYFSGTASLEAEEETDVVAKVGGIVEKILVEEGDQVKANQTLAVLDDEKLVVQLEQAKANLQKLENQYQRSEELYNKSLISAEEFQKAKYEFEHQQAAYNLAKLDLQYTRIRSPISGVIAQRQIKVGNMVLANQATFRVTGMDPLLAILHVPERQLGKLKPGHPASLKVDAMTEDLFNGHVERISPVVDPATGTVKVTVEINDTSRRLKPGMFARVHITHDVHSNTMLIPKEAVIAEDRDSRVFVIRDSMAFRQNVEIGYINTSKIEIVDGLNLGDIVVTTGKGSLKDSTRVLPIKPTRDLLAQK